MTRASPKRDGIRWGRAAYCGELGKQDIVPPLLAGRHVLRARGPGTDRYHADHIFVNLAERRKGHALPKSASSAARLFPSYAGTQEAVPLSYL
jgi:hypothetical protein